MLQSRGARHLARSWARWSAILAQDTTSTSQPWSSLVHGNQQQQKHGYRTIPTCQRSMLPRAPPIAAGQRRSMFIQTQTTPNPASLMFLPGQSVMGAEGGTKHFGSAREGMASPLAKRLFSIDGVCGVFFGTDFVTVTKRDDYTWAVLKPDIFAAIMDHFAGGEPLFLDEVAMQASDTAISADDDEVVAMIKELLDTRIRPAVRDDGGDIVYKGFDPDSGTVYLKMQGACSGCPSSSVTLKSGIENMLMHYVPEVRQVLEAPPDEGEDEGLKAFAKLEEHLSA